MRDRIWTELTQAKFSVEFASLYADRQRTALRWFNILVLIFSTAGVMGWKIWDNLPLIACGIIAIISLLRLIQPHIIMTDKQISNLDSISNFYFDYYNQLEKLWYDLEHNSKDNETVKNIFFEIKNSESKILPTINETIRTAPQSIINKAKNNSDIYFKLTFNT